MTTFVKITNKDIYDKINEFYEKNEDGHNEIIARQIKTNGRVKLNRWIATTALAGAIAIAGIIINHFSNGI